MGLFGESALYYYYYYHYYAFQLSFFLFIRKAPTLSRTIGHQDQHKHNSRFVRFSDVLAISIGENPMIMGCKNYWYVLSVCRSFIYMPRSRERRNWLIEQFRITNWIIDLNAVRMRTSKQAADGCDVTENVLRTLNCSAIKADEEARGRKLFPRRGRKKGHGGNL